MGLEVLCACPLCELEAREEKVGSWLCRGERVKGDRDIMLFIWAGGGRMGAVGFRSSASREPGRVVV